MTGFDTSREAFIGTYGSYEHPKAVVDGACTNSEAFGDTIIEYSTTADSFKRVIQRANDKLPPFSNDKNASDKGFKDCLLWFSILDYFRCHGENEVLFITND